MSPFDLFLYCVAGAAGMVVLGLATGVVIVIVKNARDS